jgi:hypothetical protein
MGDAATDQVSPWHPVEQAHNFSSSDNLVAQGGLAVEGSPL